MSAFIYRRQTEVSPLGAGNYWLQKEQFALEFPGHSLNMPQPEYMFYCEYLTGQSYFINKNAVSIWLWRDSRVGHFKGELQIFETADRAFQKRPNTDVI
jgi:hypothetical protein